MRVRDYEYNEDNDRILNRVEQIYLEQRRQIEKHKWIESEKAGRDLKNEAIEDWINKFGSKFRKWIETIPSECMDCGLCSDGKKRKYCRNPFNPERIDRINKHKFNDIE